MVFRGGDPSYTSSGFDTALGVEAYVWVTLWLPGNGGASFHRIALQLARTRTCPGPQPPAVRQKNFHAKVTVRKNQQQGISS